MKNILVPIDFSDCSKHAADAAYLLARKFGARLHLFSCLDLPRDWHELSEAERLEDKWAQETLQEGEAQLLELKNTFPEVAVETVCVGMELNQQIAAYAGQHHIDLVVMGSHGTAGKNEFFIGSNTQKVVRTLHCPVLVLKEPLDRLEFKKVIFASGFGKEELPSFERFKDFIQHFGPEVHLVAVHTSLFDAPFPILKEAMKPFAEMCQPLVCHSHIYKDLSVDEGVRSFSKELGADLISISNHERHPLKRMLVGSNVELLVNHSSLPVLTIDFE